MNYKSIEAKYIENSIIFNVAKNEEHIEDFDEHQNSISQINFRSFDDIFDKINKSKNDFIALYSSICTLHENVCNGGITPYFQSFCDLGINHIIFDLLHQKQAKNIIIVIEIITYLIYSSDDYFQDLLNVNIIPLLIALYSERVDLYFPIVNTFAIIAQKRNDLIDQILIDIDIESLFLKLSNSSITKKEKKICFRFIENILKKKDLSYDFVQLCLNNAKILLEQWEVDPWLPKEFFLIILGNICEFQTESCKKLYQVFQEYSREIQLVDLVLSVLEENNEFIQNHQNPEYRCSHQKYIDSNDSEFNLNCLFKLVSILLEFVAIFFEQPVQCTLNLPFFVDLANNDDSRIRTLSLFFIGNMFESMPSTISEMFSLDFFDMLNSQIEASDNDTQAEILICCATAICFSDCTIRSCFAQNNYLTLLVDSIYTIDKQILYMIIDSIAFLIDTICIESGPEAALEAFLEACDEEASNYEKYTKNDEKSTKALEHLKYTIAQIEQSLGEE